MSWNEMETNRSTEKSGNPVVETMARVMTGASKWYLSLVRSEKSPEATPPSAQAARGAVVTHGEPATLRQLGVPRDLANDLEAVLRSMGAVSDGRVVGYTFRTSHDSHHEILVDEPANRAA
jgi:hypothetical protein